MDTVELLLRDSRYEPGLGVFYVFPKVRQRLWDKKGRWSSLKLPQRVLTELASEPGALALLLGCLQRLHCTELSPLRKKKATSEQVSAEKCGPTSWRVVWLQEAEPLNNILPGSSI